MAKKHMVAALNEALRICMKEDENVLILGEDVGIDGGVFRVTEGLIDEFGDNRVIDTPVAEAAVVGAGIGMAIGGLKPIAEMQFSGFSYQAFAHIKQHMARFRQRTEGTMTVPLVVRAPYAGGIRALEHHSESPESFYAHCQGLKVVIPSNPYDAKGLLIAAVESKDPVIFLEPKKLYRSFREEVPEEKYSIEIGKANVVQEGKDVTVISYGSMMPLCKELAAEYEKSVELIDLRTIHPLDMETILSSAKKTGRVVVVHEAQKNLGVGAEIAARIQEEIILNLKAPVIRVGAPNVPYPQFALENYYIPTKKRILKGMEEVFNY